MIMIKPALVLNAEDEDIVPLRWSSYSDYVNEEYVNTAAMSCSNQHIFSLRNHKIDSGGQVTPSVVCTKCNFHEMIQLEGWKG